MIARIYALLPREKRTKDVSISWTSSHTKADTPLAEGNLAAELLAARGRVASCIYSAPRAPPWPLLHRVRSKPRPPRGSSASALLRRTQGAGISPSRHPLTLVWQETAPSLACVLSAISHAFLSCQCLSPAHVWILWGPSWRL